MKRKMRKGAVVLAAILALSNVSLISASAVNCSDTTWTAGNSYWRHKEDASGVYVKNLGNDATSVCVKGRYYESLDTYPVNVNRNTGATIANTENVLIPRDSERRIKQFVYENNFYFAYVTFTGGSNGKWSPDTCGGGSIPYAN